MFHLHLALHTVVTVFLTECQKFSICTHSPITLFCYFSAPIGQMDQPRFPQQWRCSPRVRYRTLPRATLELTTLNGTQLLAILVPPALSWDH